MPVLELHYSPGGLDEWVFWRMLAVMLFPSDAEARKCFLGVEQMKAWQEGMNYGEMIIPTLEVIEILLQAAQAPKPIEVQMRHAIWQGSVAGDVLRLIASMQALGYDGSIRKALSVLIAVDYEKGCSLAGQNVPRNPTQLRKAWSAYKSVAHVWAAYRHTHILRNTPGYAEAGSVLALQPLCEKDPMLLFLALAEGYRQFGMHHKGQLHAKAQSTLNTDCGWIVRIAGDVPCAPTWPLPPYDLPALPLTDKQKVALQSYVPNPNRTSTR